MRNSEKWAKSPNGIFFRENRISRDEEESIDKQEEFYVKSHAKIARQESSGIFRGNEE